MPDLTTLITNGEATPVVNAAGASPIVDPFAKLLYDYNTAVKNDAKVPSIVTQDTGVSNQPIQLEDADSYLKYGVYLNDVDTQEQLNRRRAENQSALEQFGRMAIQTVGDRMVLGSLRGFSDLADLAISTFTGDRDFTNPVSQTIEGWQEAIRDRFEIYREDPNKAIDPTDLAWYLNGIPDIASTISLLIPAAGTSKLLSYAGKTARGISAIDKAVKSGKTVSKALAGRAGINGVMQAKIGAAAENLSMAGLMRAAENYQEARESYKNIYDDTLTNLSLMGDEERAALYRRHPEYSNMSDEDIATKLAEEGATDVFKDDFWMLIFDAWQLRGITNMYKNLLSRGTTAAIRDAERIAEAGLLGRTIEKSGINKFIPSFDAVKNYAAELSEGFEEGFQYVQQQEAEDNARAILNPAANIRTMSDYMMDDQMWNAAIWGAVGGIAFKGIGEAASKYYNSINSKRQDVSSAMRVADIQQRTGQVSALMKDIQDLNNGRVARVDSTGDYIKDSEGNIIYDEVTPIDAEVKKEELLNRHLTNVVVNAANVGNYDLAKQFFNSQEFKEYVGTFNSMADEQTSNEFINDVSQRMDDIFDTYYSEILNATNAGIEDYRIAQNVAYNNTTKALGIKNANKRQAEYERVVSELQQDILDKSSDNQRETLNNFFDKVSNNFIYNTIDANIQNVENLKSQAKKQLDDGKIGELQYNNIIKAYDDFINTIVSESNLIDSEGKKVTRNNIQEEINKNKLSNSDLNTLRSYGEDLYDAYDKSNAAKIDASYFSAKTIKTADEYKNAAKQWENIGREAAKKGYDDAVAQMENLYNSNNVDEVTTYIATKQPGSLSEETRRNIDDAYNAMVDFATPFDDIERTIDKIARTANKQKQPRNATGPINNIQDDGSIGGPPVGDTTTDTATPTPDTINSNPAPTTPEVTPEVVPEVTPEQTQEENITPEPTSDEANDSEFNASMDSKIKKALAGFINEATNTVLSKDEFISRVKDGIVANEKISKEYLDKPAIKQAFDSNINMIYDIYRSVKSDDMSSVANFDRIILNYDEATEKEIEQLIDSYVKELDLTSANRNKTYVNPNNLIKYIINKYKERNRQFSYDNILDVYDKIFDYLKSKESKYKILNVSDKKNRLRTGKDIEKLLRRAIRDDIESDNRINVLNFDSIASAGVSIEDFNYAMSMIKEGTELYVNRGATGRNGVYSVQFYYNKPGGRNEVKIAYNTFRPMPHGEGYYFTAYVSDRPILMSIKKDGENYTSDFDAMFKALLLNDTSKYTAEQIESARSFIFTYGVEGNIDEVKTNPIILDFINKADDRNVNTVNDKELYDAAERINNIVYYKDYSIPDEEDFGAVYNSYQNFLKRMYNNYEYTKAIYDAIGREKNKVVKIPVKSINRGKPIYEDEAIPLKDAITSEFDYTKGGKAEIIFQVGGEMVSEGGYRQTTSNSPDANLIHVFNLYLPTGGRNNPEFVNLEQANVDTSSPYGGAIKEEIMSLFTKYVNKKINFDKDNRKRTPSLIDKLNAIFNDDGLVHGVDAQLGVVKGVRVYTIKLFNDTKPRLYIWENNNDGKTKAYSVTVPTQNGFYNVTKENDLNGVEKVIDKLLSEAVYAFPGNIILGNSLYDKNGYIKRITDKKTGTFKGYNISVGNYKKSFSTFGNFIVDSGIAKTRLRKVTYTRKNSSVESNFNYAGYKERASWEAPRFTASDINYADSSEEEAAIEAATERSKTYSADVLNTVEERKEITIKTSNVLNGMAPRYMRRINSIPMELFSINDLFPEEVKVTNENRSDYGFYRRGNPGQIYLTRKYFKEYGDPASGNTHGAYDAIRVLLHENIHKQIYESNSVNFDDLNKTLTEVREALNRALFDENSEEYKDLNRAFANVESVRQRMIDGIRQIEQSYNDLPEAERNNAINEEYLVESMTSELFQNVANNIYLKGETAIIDKNKPAEKKSLLQRIFDFIRKLFNFGDVKDNTLLAKEFNALAKAVTETRNEEEKANTVTNQNTSTPANKTNVFGQRGRNNRVRRSIATFEMPSINSIEKSNSIAENVKFRRLVERGELNLRCV